MGKLIERCAGIDIGKRFLLCCVMTGAAHEEPRGETRRFDTTVPGLERLRGWLNDEHVTDVVMESTGSYWIPVFNLLEGHVTVVLANPEEVKNRKGHKTDRTRCGEPGGPTATQSRQIQLHSCRAGRAIFAGWLIALMVWLLPGAESARVSIIIIVTYLVGVSGFNHIVAGSTTMFFLIVTKSISWGTYITQFFLPTLVGNVFGGLSLVAALGHAKVVGGKGTIEESRSDTKRKLG